MDVRGSVALPRAGFRVRAISAGAAEMQSTIADVAAVTEQTSAATEQVSASAQQTSASVSEIASSASEMAANAQKLAELFAADQPAATAGTSGQAPRRASSAQ